MNRMTPEAAQERDFLHGKLIELRKVKNGFSIKKRFNGAHSRGVVSLNLTFGQFRELKSLIEQIEDTESPRGRDALVCPTSTVGRPDLIKWRMRMTERDLIYYAIGVLEGVNSCKSKVELSGPIMTLWDGIDTRNEATSGDVAKSQ